MIPILSPVLAASSGIVHINVIAFNIRPLEWCFEIDVRRTRRRGTGETDVERD